MNIGIDARMYGLENAGIGRYIINLSRELFALDKKNTYTLFLRSKYARILKVPKNVRKVTVNFRHYTLEEQTKFPQIIEKYNVDLMHFPHFNIPILYNKPFVVTIHDLLWHKTKGLTVTSLSPLKYALKYLGYRAVVNHALAKAKTIIVPSHYVKQDVINYGGQEEKIIVSYEGVDVHLAQAKKTNSAVLIKRMGLEKPYIVYTGSAYPHKNIPFLIDAVLKMNNQEKISLQLALISSRTIFLDKLKKYVHQHKLTDKVIFTGYLPDSSVKAVYDQAVALVHPSLSEGFGLTGLEAMSVGLPVLSSDSASLPEIYSDAALYFDPKDTSDLIAKIKQVLFDQAKQQEMRAKGFDRVQSFSWSTMAKDCLAIYKNAVNKT